MGEYTLAEVRNGTGWPAGTKFRLVEDYNGWSNYVTWCMALWIDNDQASYTYSRELAHSCWETANSDDGRGRSAASILAHHLQEWQEESYDEPTEKLAGTVWADLLGAAWSDIDWYEIAANYLSELSNA